MSSALLSHVVATGSKLLTVGGAVRCAKSVGGRHLFPIRNCVNMSYSTIERGSPYTADYRVYIRKYSFIHLLCYHVLIKTLALVTY